MSSELPAGPIVMRQRWESLLFMHWRYSIEAIQATLPPSLRVDTFEGEGYVGIVPFLMRKVRPRFLFCISGLSDFLELNLRTYVVDAQGRKGVWFYSLDANQSLAVWIAQKLFSLPYRNAKMRYALDEDGWESFQSQRPSAELQRFLYCGSSTPKPAVVDSLEAFLVERYRLFSYNESRHSLHVGQIHHEPYRISEVEVRDYSKELFALNGLKAPQGPPDHQVLAQPVDVNIYPLRRAH